MNKLFPIIFVAVFIMGFAAANVSVVGGLSRSHTVEPGAVFDGSVTLRNSADVDADVSIYQTDYLFSAEGGNQYGEPGTAPRSNAPWITLGSSVVTVPAGQAVSVSYQGRLPEDSGLKGSYWSLIMVEESAPVQPAAPGQAQQPAVGIRTVKRHGIQIVTEIGDTGERALTFADPVLREDETTHIPLLQVDIANTGERFLHPETHIELFDKDGVPVGRYGGRKARIYPGTSVRQRIALDGLAPGTYEAVLIADAGSDAVFGVRYTLRIDPDD